MLNRSRWLMIAVLLVGFTLIRASAQGGPSADLIKAVVRFLSTQLNKPIAALDNYTYESVSFKDTSLDCPQQGQSYKPGPLAGYKFLVTFQGISYDVRATIDGGQLLLCRNTALKQTVALALYRTAQYSLPYPGDWLIVERETDVFFGIDQRPICSQPGMFITPLGEVGSKGADTLIEEYSRTLVNAQFVGERSDIRQNGRSAIILAPCTDGTPRQQRVSVFISYGRAFRIVQYAPQSAFDQWADIYLRIMSEFALAGPDIGGQPVTAPGVSPRASLAHLFAGNVYVGILADLPGTPITTGGTPEQPYQDVTLSPKGDIVAFIDPNQGVLYIAPAAGGEQPRALATNVNRDYPITWSPRGDEIAYITKPESGPLVLMAASISGRGTREIGKTSAQPNGCPGEIIDPAERFYASEGGIRGNYRNFLIWTRDDTFYYSLSCGVGLVRLAAGQTQVIQPDVYRVRLAPDEKEFIGLMELPNQNGAKVPAFVRISLTGENIVAFKVAAGVEAGAPDQVAWSADGKIVYYSMLTLKETIKVDDLADAERGKQVFGSYPFQAHVYEVELHGIDLGTGVDRQLFKGEGRGIGRIAPDPDGSGVLFTVVQSSKNLIEAFRTNVSAGELRQRGPVSQLYWAPQKGQALLLAISSAPVWGPKGSAPAPTPTGASDMPTGNAPTRTPRPTWTPFVAPITPGNSAQTTPLSPPPTNTPRHSPTPKFAG